MNRTAATIWNVVILNTLIPVLILGGAVMAARRWIDAKEPPSQGAPPRLAPLVEVIEAESSDIPVRTSAQGTVVAARQTVVQVEVAGRLTHVHEALQVGGVVRAGDELVRVDPRDYRIALLEAQAAVAQAETSVELEEARQYIAQREWELLRGDDPSIGDAALAQREPQMRAALLTVEAATLRERRAELMLSKTSVRAPFDAIVVQEAVEVGQVVSAQSQVATLVAVDAFHVHARVPVDALPDVAIPGVNAAAGGEVTVEQALGDLSSTHAGRVLRLLGSVDPAARLATVVVEVADPLGLSAEGGPPGARAPLLLGSWVTATLDAGRTRSGVLLPRRALRDGRHVWVVDEGGSMSIRAVDVTGGDAEQVELASGIAAGERVVLTHVATPVDGMSLRVAGETPEGSR